MSNARRLFFSVLAFAACPGAARADYAHGVAAYAHADYAVALREFTEGAEMGDPRCEDMLGGLYAMGLGTRQNFITAWIWETRAALAGIGEANAARVTLENIMTPAQRIAAHAVLPADEVADLPRPPYEDVPVVAPAPIYLP